MKQKGWVRTNYVRTAEGVVPTWFAASDRIFRR
jgi:hypothetical protein